MTDNAMTVAILPELWRALYLQGRRRAGMLSTRTEFQAPSCPRSLSRSRSRPRAVAMPGHVCHSAGP
jgi:hypothetical protein